MSKKPSKNLTIRNSTAEFPIFTNQAGESGIEVRYENETIWLTQKLMAELFDVERSVITKHLKNIFNDNELQQGAVCAKFAHTANEHLRNIFSSSESHQKPVIRKFRITAAFDKETKKLEKQLRQESGGGNE